MFLDDLDIGHKHQQLIGLAFDHHGIQITPTEGKHPFDGFLPTGHSLECKFDLYSLVSGNAAIEYPTLKRCADFYVHTICFTKVFTYEEYKWLYNRGKVVRMGDQFYDGRLINRLDFKSKGMFIDQFARQLILQQ